MSVEGGRLEGVILRSQLLVLLQRRHFCDQHGRPVGREYSEKEEIDLEVSCGMMGCRNKRDVSCGLMGCRNKRVSSMPFAVKVYTGIVYIASCIKTLHFPSRFKSHIALVVPYCRHCFF